ncbi:hypothetical protein BWD121_000730 [Bartonella sp. WD12.1]|nr:hypothetical protein BWD121_000730 [Bartonella sp. WD12.1]
MRRVLKHHVCFCFLSTALLAGVSLIATQEKVYAQSQGNCRVVADTGSDGEQPIVCGGRERGDASDVVLRDNRDIDMGKYLGMPAVEVHGDADITMSGTLRVTNTGDRGRSSNDNQPAIKVHDGGVLKLMEATIVDVSKGIEADGGFVTVVAGSIGVKNGGDAVIEVSKGGRVTLMMKGRGVSGGGSNSTGIEVGDGGGTVELMGTGFTDVKTGIMIKGAGEASVTMTGKGTTITVGSNGKGIVMEGQGEAEVTGGTIEGSGSVVGAVVSSGTLTLMGTSFTKVTMGAQVSGDGKLKIEGSSTKITVTKNGVGLNVSGKGSATVTNVKIVGNEKGQGVVMMGEGEVTLMGTTVESFSTGVSVSDGTVKINGESMIKAAGDGVGIKVEGGTLKINGESTIEAKGKDGVGIKVEGTGKANVNMMGGKIQGHGNESGQGIGVDMAGEGTVELTKVTVSGFETGVKVTNGTMKIEGSSKITATGQKAVGVEVKGTGVLKINGESTITAEGDNGVGLQITGGKAEVTGGEISIGGVFGRGATMGVSVSGTGEAELKDVKIMGKGRGDDKGVEVNTSSKEEVKLTNVDISKVMYGVSVSKGTVKISGELTKIAATGTGLSVQGGTVTMTRGTISEGGVSVEDGTLMMTKGEIKGFTTEGVNVGISVTRADLTGTIITGKGSGTGVKVEDKKTSANLTLKDVMVSKVATGVEMNGAGALTIEGSSTIQFKGKYGVYVGGEVTKAELTKTVIRGEGNGSEYGVYVKSGATASLTLTDVKISKVATGVEMNGTGALTVSGSSTIEFTSDNGYGVYVGSSVKSATLTKTKIMGKGGGQGVYVAGGNVTLKDVMVSKVGIGVQMNGAGALTIEGSSTIEFKRKYGVYVGGEVTRADLTGTKITGTGASEYGVYAGDKVMGEVTMTTITGRRSHEVRGALRGALRGRTVRLEGVQISGVQKGVHVTRGGTLTMNQGSIEFKGNGYGVYVGKGVTKADLTNVTVTGKDNKGVGVYAMGGRTMVMTLTDVKISGVGMGIFAAGGGMLAIGGTSTIGFQGKYGVYVGKDVMGEVAMTTITGSGEAVRSGTGVYVNGGAAWLGGTTLKSVAKGMTVENGIVVMQNGVIKFHGEHGVLLKQGNALLVNVGMKYEGNNADATFLKVDATEGVNKADIKGALIEIDGQGKGLGVHVMNGGRVMLKNTVLANVVKGVDVFFRRYVSFIFAFAFCFLRDVCLYSIFYLIDLFFLFWGMCLALFIRLLC